MPEITYMEAKKSTAKYWSLCFLWLVILVLLIVFYRQFFWIAIPGFATYFAKGLELF